MTPSKNETLIDAKGVSLSKSGKEILKNVDLSIDRNEIVTLIGPNGAGKSTLLEIAIGLQQADSGTVSRKRGLTVAYVPQKIAVDPILPLSVSRLMQLTKKVTDKRMDAALSETKSIHLKESMVADLSGGELQRVLLARAIAQDADLLVLDEPAQGVDYAGQAELYFLIEKLRNERNCGILLISHDIHIVMAATDKVVCLNGHVCCAGQPETVSSDPAYKALFGVNAPESLAIYNHQHDHDHDLDGSVVHKGQSIGHIHGPHCDHDTKKV